MGLPQEPPAEVLTHPEIRTFAATEADFDMDGPDRFIMDANGEDVWSSWDQYAAFYKKDVLGETGTIETKVVDQEQGISDKVKTGIWVKNDLTKPGESLGYLNFFVTPGNGIKIQYDENENGFINSTGPILKADGKTVQVEYPAWLRLEKDGTTFTAFYSTDGSDWTEVGSIDIPSANATQDVGLATTSHRPDHVKARVELEGFDVE